MGRSGSNLWRAVGFPKAMHGFLLVKYAGLLESETNKAVR